MSVEVRELVIKALVTQEDSKATGATSAAANDNSNAAPDELSVKNTIDRILEILRAKNER